MQPRYNETLHNEVLGLTNSLLYPSYSEKYEKEPRSVGKRKELLLNRVKPLKKFSELLQSKLHVLSNLYSLVD